MSTKYIPEMFPGKISNWENMIKMEITGQLILYP
jgi:hypothetical protein